MVDIPTLLSILSLLVSGLIGYFNWRSGRFQPQVDVSDALLKTQQVASQAVEGQAQLAGELTDLKRHLQGSYEVRVVVKFYPRPEIMEAGMRLLTPTKRAKAAGD